MAKAKQAPRSGEVLTARESGQREAPKRGTVANLLPGSADLHIHAPQVRAAQTAAAMAEIEPAPVPVSANDSANPGFHRLLTNQSVALLQISFAAPDAAKYLAAVACGRKKGEQWRMAAARDVLDRVAATGATVTAAQMAQAAAARADADLVPLLTRLADARALAARKAAAVDVDAVHKQAESGQISGTGESA